MSASDTSAPHSIDALYRDHNGWLRGWLRRELGCSERAADVAHDTFLRLLGSERSSVMENGRKYLAQIARNLLTDLWRRQRIEQAYLDARGAQPDAVDISEETRLDIIETLIAIDRMLDALGARPREIFLLVQLDGLSFVDVAQRLGISVNTARKHFIRALTQCLALVEAEG